MMRLLLAAAIAALAVPASSQAEPWMQGFKTGNQLHADCQEEIPRACLAYIQGATDAVVTTRTARLMMKQPVGPPCLPAGVTAGQVLDVVRSYLAANPATRHEGAYLLVLSALQEAFPCSQSGSSP